LHYNPAAAPGGIQGEDLEFIELMNVGSQTINLAGVQITQFGETPYTFASRFLAPGERIVVARDPAVFQTVYGTEINLASTGYGGANLSNGGERIALFGPLGEELQDFVFDDEVPWPTSPDGEGYSLQIIDPMGDASDPANWRASLHIGGSPGAADVAIPGDYDGNGLVEDADAAVWRASYGLTVANGAGADGNRDGVVNAADYVVWRRALMAAPPAAASGTLSMAAGAVETSTESAPNPSTSLRTVNVGASPDRNDRSGFNPLRRSLGSRSVSREDGSVSRQWDLLLATEVGNGSRSGVDGPSRWITSLVSDYGPGTWEESGEMLEPPSTVWDDDAWLDGLFAARLV
jgi:hypothetical protein